MSTKTKSTSKPVTVCTHPQGPNATKVCDALQGLGRQRRVIIKSRMMQENRLQAIVAGQIGYTASMEGTKRTELFKEARRIIKEIDKETMVNVPQSVMCFHTVIKVTLVGINAFREHQEIIEQAMIEEVTSLPIADWAQLPEQKGFGLKSLAVVLGEISDWSWMTNPGKLWKRFGLAPYDNGTTRLMGSTWKSGRLGKLTAEQWQEFGYSPRRRSVMYVIAECLLKQNGAGPYRARYDEAKERARELHPDEKLWPKQRCHRHAMAMASKLLLKRIWLEWMGHPEERITWED